MKKIIRHTITPFVMSNFEKVRDFNLQFGVPSFDHPQLDIFTQNPQLIQLRMNLIREEMAELEEAVHNHDYTETIDALSDILYVVYGMGVSIGMNMDNAFDIVHCSNMSKLCKTEEEAQATVAWYTEQYSLGTQPYDSPSYRKSTCGEYWVVYNKSTGKILKSINYHLVDFSEIIKK